MELIFMETGNPYKRNRVSLLMGFPIRHIRIGRGCKPCIVLLQPCIENDKKPNPGLLVFKIGFWIVARSSFSEN